MAGRIFQRKYKVNKDGKVIEVTAKNWTVEVDTGTEDGRRQQYFRTFKTKKEAERELRIVLTNLETGAYLKPTDKTVGQYLDEWLCDYAKDNTTPRTYERYEEIAVKHLKPALGSIPLAKLQPQDIQAYYKQALASGRRVGKGGLSAQTVQHHHRVLFTALRYAVRQNIIARNVAESVQPPRVQYKELVTADAEGIDRLLEAAKDTPYYVLFYTAIYTGLRRSELLALRWRNVNLDLAELYVTETLHQLKTGEYIIGQPKSRRARRNVALSPKLALLLREYKTQQSSICKMLDRELQPDDLVFATHSGDPIQPDRVTKAFRRLAKTVGFENLRFHDLRHTHATIMLQQGIHPKIVSERLGHSTIELTLNTYSHVLPGLQEAAALSFEEGLNVNKTAKIMLCEQNVSNARLGVAKSV